MIHSQIKNWKVQLGIGVPPSTGAKEGLQWLLLGRLVALYLLFGAGLLPRFFSGEALPFLKLLDGYLLLGAAFLSILSQSVFLDRLGNSSWAAVANLTFDTCLISLWLLWHPESSLFVLLYLVQILLVALTFFQRGALLAAVAASAGFGLVSMSIGGELGYFAWAIYTALFMTVGVVGGYLSEELLRTTERLREKTLRVERLVSLQEKILSSLPTGLLTMDGEGVVHFANPAACNILHLVSEQLVGKRLAEASSELMPFFSQIEATPLTEDLPEESHVDVRLSQTRDDFHRIFVESQLHRGSTRLQQVVELGTGRDRRILRGDVAELNTGDAYAGGLLSKQAQGGRVLLFQDVTKLIQLEDKLKQHEKLAAVGQLAAGIAHEIRNPLASMSASIEMLRDGDAKQLDGPESHKLMDIAIREIDRLNLLITEFLDFVKPDKMTLEPFDIGTMLEEVLSSVRAGQKDSAHRIEFKTSFPKGTLALASGEKLRQVVWNFVINSIQAIPDKGVVEVGCAASGNHHVRFWVSDSGHGMSEETMAHLFEPFFTTKQRGTGLGLATAYKIVEAHHGEIRVESTKGKGTRFEVLLPRA